MGIGFAVLLAAAALAGQPVDGGRYEGTGDGPAACPGCRNDVKLWVADDGRSLLGRSYVEAGSPCPGRSGGVRVRAPGQQSIRSDGSFGWRVDGIGVVSGRFAAGGRSARGEVRFDCPGAPVGFRAALAGRERRTRCDDARRGPLRIEIAHRGVGCTTATRVAERWLRACRPARTCVAAGYRCAPVRGGRLKALAGVACYRGSAGVEFVVRRRCASFPRAETTAEVQAISTSCVSAERVAGAFLDGRRTRGWSCEEVFEAVFTRCRPARARHVAVEIVIQLQES